MNTEKILRLQAACRACTTVWAVYVRCEGETSLDALYETKAAAELHRDHHNGMRGNANGYYGRASVGTLQIRTEAIARDWFSTQEQLSSSEPESHP